MAIRSTQKKLYKLLLFPSRINLTLYTLCFAISWWFVDIESCPEGWEQNTFTSSLMSLDMSFFLVGLPSVSQWRPALERLYLLLCPEDRTISITGYQAPSEGLIHQLSELTSQFWVTSEDVRAMSGCQGCVRAISELCQSNNRAMSELCQSSELCQAKTDVSAVCLMDLVSARWFTVWKFAGSLHSSCRQRSIK